MYKTIELDCQHQSAFVYLNRPQVHNALNETAITELSHVFKTLAIDPQIRVIVLGQRGENFCAGADLGWMKSTGNATQAKNEEEARKLAQMLYTLYRCPKPTIARVQGAVVGGGLGLASVCDVCIATENSFFRASEVRLGLIAATIGPYLIRAIGPRLAGRYLLSAEKFSASVAHSMGLVHDVSQAETTDDLIQTWIHLFLQGGPKAQAASKALIQDIAYDKIDKSMCETTALKIAQIRSSDEAQKGLSAFFAKQDPDWLNH